MALRQSKDSSQLKASMSRAASSLDLDTTDSSSSSMSSSDESSEPLDSLPFGEVSSALDFPFCASILSTRFLWMVSV